MSSKITWHVYVQVEGMYENKDGNQDWYSTDYNEEIECQSLDHAVTKLRLIGADYSAYAEKEMQKTEMRHINGK